MSNEDEMYRQCKLSTIDANGSTVYQTCWIPEFLAGKGFSIALKDDTKFIWKVLEVYEYALPWIAIKAMNERARKGMSSTVGQK